MPPPRSIILCATPRSGSTLLCTLLRQVRAAGHPESWFRKEDRDAFAAEWGLPPDPDFAIYLSAALRAGQSPNGVFALRIMADTLPELTGDLARLYGPAPDPALLARAFGPPAFIRLVRTDTVAQAVSRHRAEGSGLWHRHADGRPLELLGPAPRPVAYDQAAIAGYLTEIEDMNRRWERWFETYRITPVCLTYEALAAAPGAALQTLLAALGLPFDGSPTPGTARLADSESTAWAARFRQETGRP